MTETECWRCRRGEDEVTLVRCKMCRRHVCEEHSVVKSGVTFCSLGCSAYFFHAEPEDGED